METTESRVDRAEFEAWAKTQSYNVAMKPGDKCYFYNSVELAWLAWQASRATLPQAGAAVDGSEGDEFWTTGHAEADRLIGRLLSSDPEFEDCTEAAVLIRKLVLEEINGPDGHATWKDAAIAERAARSQAAPSPAPSPWQPIETAPKDQEILVGPTKRMGICVAMNHSRDGWVTETCSEWVPIYTPTHWMPLPPPPASVEGG